MIPAPPPIRFAVLAIAFLTACAPAPKPNPWDDLRVRVEPDVDIPPAFANGMDSFIRSVGFPPNARREGVRGIAVVKFEIDESGRVTDAGIAKSLHREIDTALLRAAEQVSFTPAINDGHAVAVTMWVPVRFETEGLHRERTPVRRY